MNNSVDPEQNTSKPATRRGLWIGLAAALLVFLVASVMLNRGPSPLPPAPPPVKPSVPVAPPFDEAKLNELDQLIGKAMSEHRLPGGVLHVEHEGVIYEKTYGKRQIVPSDEAMTLDTIFDLASLTKVIATTPSVMLLVEQGKIDLNAPASRYLPAFTGEGRDDITVRQLMTHTSGLRPGMSVSGIPTGYDAGIARLMQEKPVSKPGTEFVYSDLNFIMLAEIVRQVGGQRIDVFSQTNFFQPLKMTETGYLPDKSLIPRIAPTEVIDGEPLRGVVHDPTARHMDGVAGHAGLFSTIQDLSRFCRMMLNYGELDGVRVLATNTVRLMTSVQTPAAVEGRRGLGWDIDTGYSRHGKVFPLGSYGHTGFTGTMVWIDPFSRTFVLFLSNRVHPDGHGDIRALERAITTAAAGAVRGFDFTHVEGALAPAPPKVAATNLVLNGIDVLAKENFARLRGLKLGLITNHTGRDRHGQATIELLAHAPDVELKALFSPEHGIRGEADEKVGDSTDARTGLPVYSLYGDRRAPTTNQLEGLDALVFDIQDIGTRFYTYIATLGNCLEAAGKAHLKFFILDRVNPVGGVEQEGPINEGDPIFTAFHPIPVRHGLTIGELGRLINQERGFGVTLEVVPIEGWKREMWFDQTGLSWINPSPNMRSLTEAILYPGVGLLETTAVSVGRGTDAPFEKVGAPYIDENKLADELNELNLPGLRFEPIRFTPDASVFKGKSCGGVRIVLVDRNAFRPVRTGVAIAQKLSTLYPDDFKLPKFNTHLRNAHAIEMIQSGASLDDIVQSWSTGLEDYKKRTAGVLLYQ